MNATSAFCTIGIVVSEERRSERVVKSASCWDEPARLLPFKELRKFWTIADVSVAPAGALLNIDELAGAHFFGPRTEHRRGG